MAPQTSIEVSREIPAAAANIFGILSNPQRHRHIDGSQMITGSQTPGPISRVGDQFTMTMHRAGDDYLMINIVTDFEANHQIFWTPAPGDTSRSEGHLEENVGKPAGYKWGYVLEPINDQLTKVTEIFEFGPLNESHFEDGGKWINTKNTVEESMAKSLELIENEACG